MNVYHQELIDHYHYPRHKGVLEAPDFVSEVHNPSCGDIIAWQGIVKGGIITTIAFTGKGCVISQAVASMLACKSIEQSIADILSWNTQTIMTMIHMELGPTRLKCALLPLEALQAGVQKINA